MTSKSSPGVAPAHGREAAEVREPWLTLARFAIIAYSATIVMLFVIALPVRYRALVTVCTPVESCGALYLSALEVAAMPDWFGLSGYAIYLIAVEMLMLTVGLSVAGLIFIRLSHTRMGLLTVATVAWVSFPDEAVSALAAAAPLVQAISPPLEILGLALFWLFLLVFPNGRIEPTWARRFLPLPLTILLIVQVVGLLVRWGLLSEQRLSALEPIWFALVFLTVLFPFALQIVRYRRYASPEQRQQVKWGLVGLAGMMLGFALWATIDPAITPVPNGPPRLIWNLLGWTLTVTAGILMPVTLAYSILRRRLWDIDLIINRALVYGSLTVTLTGVYLGTVVLVQQVVLSGRDAPLVVAGSTLLIAALFAPLRRRIQAFIDRRFYRHKVDSQKALATFAVTARNEVDLDALSTELLRVVGETVHPKMISLWLQREHDARKGEPS